MNYEGERKNQKNMLQKFADSKIILTFAPQLRTKRLQNMLETTGEMAEWSIAAVLKTVELRGSGGSNPSLSAINAENQQIIKQTPNFTPKNVKLGVFILFKTNHIRSENNLIKNRTNEKNNQFIFRKISYLCSK